MAGMEKETRRQFFKDLRTHGFVAAIILVLMVVGLVGLVNWFVGLFIGGT